MSPQKATCLSITFWLLYFSLSVSYINFLNHSLDNLNNRDDGIKIINVMVENNFVDYHRYFIVLLIRLLEFQQELVKG